MMQPFLHPVPGVSVYPLPPGGVGRGGGVDQGSGRTGVLAHMEEHRLCKSEAAGSSPVNSTAPHLYSIKLSQGSGVLMYNLYSNNIRVGARVA